MWTIHNIVIKEFLQFFPFSIRMSKKSINFDDKKINNSNFFKNKKPFEIHDVDIDNVLIFKKEPYGKKALI